MRLLSIFIGLTLNAMLLALSFLVPKKKGTILLGGGLGKSFSGNPKYLFLHLHGRGRAVAGQVFESTWITRDDHVLTQLRKAGLPVVDARTIKGFWHILRSEFLVIESGTAIGSGAHDIAYERVFIGRYKIIQTWHGSPLKRINLDALGDRENPGFLEKLYKRVLRVELGRLTAILALSDADKAIFETAFDNRATYKLGYPKNDMLVDGAEAWGVALRYRQYAKVILYAPTFRDHPDALAPFTSGFLGHLDQILAEHNWCMLIKKHPYDRGLTVPPHLGRVLDVTREEKDIQELLVQTDLLITDYSSVFVDFLLRDKPQIAYVYDLDDYIARSRGMYYDLREVMPGPVAEKEDELLELILTSDSWYEEEYYRERRQAVMARFHEHVDSGACQRLTQALENGFDN